jgi:hypothetical protein
MSRNLIDAGRVGHCLHADLVKRVFDVVGACQRPRGPIVKAHVEVIREAAPLVR